jgi:dihydrofolate reductase
MWSGLGNADQAAVGVRPLASGDMSRVVYWTSASLDGFIADEHDSLDWLFEVPRGGDADSWEAFIDRVGVLVMGATTYQWTLDRYFTDHPERWPEFHGDHPCWVFTHRELAAVPGVEIHFTSGEVRSAYDAIATAAGEKDIGLVGGGDLVGQFDDAGLLDEIHVHLTPVVLGAGAPLLPRRITSQRLRFREGGMAGQRCQVILDVTRRTPQD